LIEEAKGESIEDFKGLLANWHATIWVIGKERNDIILKNIVNGVCEIVEEIKICLDYVV